jgi:NADH-quinone oxidoreductase subunit J
VETAIFVVCAAIVLGGAFGVVFSRNPVHSALSLVATLFGVAVLFLNLGAQLLAAVQVIVYTGAIVVLILFVLMLLGVDREEDITVQPMVGQGVFAGIIAALIGAGLLSVILIGGDNIVTGAHSSLQALAPDFGDIRQIGEQLFTTYVFPLEVTAVLLTIAVVGR